MVAILSNLGLLPLLTAGIAAVASFVVYREDNPPLVTLAAIGAGLFIGAYVLGFLLAVFITGAGRAAPLKKARVGRERSPSVRSGIPPQFHEFFTLLRANWKPPTDYDVLAVCS